MLLAAEDDVLEFAEVKHVAIDVDRYYFVVGELEIVRFHAHFHDYEVVRPASTTLTAVQLNTLADPHPLGLYKCHTPHYNACLSQISL